MTGTTSSILSSTIVSTSYGPQPFLPPKENPQRLSPAKEGPQSLITAKTFTDRVWTSIGSDIIASSIGRTPGISPPTGKRILTPVSPELHLPLEETLEIPSSPHRRLSSSSLLTILSSSNSSSSISFSSSSSSLSSSLSRTSSQPKALADAYLSNDFTNLQKIFLTPHPFPEQIASTLATLNENHTYPVSGVELNMGALVYYHLWKMHRHTRFGQVKDEELPKTVEGEYTLKAFLNKGGKYTSTPNERNTAIGRAYLEGLIFGLEQAVAHTDEIGINKYLRLLEEAQMSFELETIYHFLTFRSNHLVNDIMKFKENLRKVWNL